MLVQQLGHRGFTLHQLVMGLGVVVLVACLLLAYQQSRQPSSTTSMVLAASHG